MPTYSRSKTWNASETLTATDLNGIEGGLVTFFNTTQLDNDNIQSTASYVMGELVIGSGITSADGGQLHVHTASAGTIAAHADADEAVIENSAAAGISILSGNTSAGNLFFGDDGDNDIGKVSYSHSANAMTFTTNAATALTLSSAQLATFAAGVTVGGNVISDTDSTDDLGTTGVRWANLFVDDITVTTDVAATTFTGALAATSTIADGVTATTQSASDNSTKVATTAYVDALSLGADLGTANTWTADQTFNDNVKVTLGTGGDVDFYYDATNVVLNPQVVGSGKFQVLGNIQSYIDSTSTTPQVQIENDGTGDAAINFLRTGLQNWSMGIDGTDNYFKISGGAVVDNTTRITIDTSGMVGIGDTANANMTVGLTINQGANDDEILAFKSSDVAHPMTGMAEADTFGTFSKTEATNGGLAVMGFKDADGGSHGAVLIQGNLGEAADTTKSTSGRGVVRMFSAVTDGGTGVTAVGANGNLLSIENNATVRFIFDADGDSHQDVGTAWTNFDAYEDVAITRALGMELSPETIVQTKWDDWGRANKDLIYEVGLMQRLTPEQEANGERSLVNMTTLAKVHNGAIGQLYASQKDLELMVTEELEQLKAQVNNLLMERN